MAKAVSFNNSFVTLAAGESRIIASGVGSFCILSAQDFGSLFFGPSGAVTQEAIERVVLPLGGGVLYIRSTIAQTIEVLTSTDEIVPVQVPAIATAFRGAGMLPASANASLIPAGAFSGNLFTAGARGAWLHYALLYAGPAGCTVGAGNLLAYVSYDAVLGASVGAKTAYALLDRQQLNVWVPPGVAVGWNLAGAAVNLTAGEALILVTYTQA
jgi:hypothetical protein